ncbi:hypothetical protein BGZ92_008161 [Podila epicladia]|nr:hypothetical protein BGZ92_008161 [Podila epicladia]
MSIRKLTSTSSYAAAPPASLIATDTPPTRLSPIDIPEILDHIFSYLDRKTILHTARAVCRQWYHASRHFFTHPLIITGSCSKPEKFRLVLKRLPYSGSLYWKTILKRDGNGPWHILGEVLESMNKEFSPDHPLNRPGSGPLSSVRSTLMPLREFHFVGCCFWEPTMMRILPHLGSLTSLRIDKFGLEGMRIDHVLQACPKLEQLHFQRASVMVGSKPRHLSSLELARDASGPLVPSPSDKTLQLKALTLNSCHVDLTTLADIVAVSPRLVKLELVAMTLTDKPSNSDDPRARRKVEHDEFVTLISRACPNLYRLHYSTRWTLAPMALKAVEALFRDISYVPERSHLMQDLNPFLTKELLSVRNVLTTLEIIADPLYRPRPRMGVDLMDTGLHKFLCAAPLLRELILSGVHCDTSRLDPFPTYLQSEPHGMSPVENALEQDGLQLWACRGLQTLSLYFTQSYNVSATIPTQLTGRDVRVVFSYLTRVCPNLRHVDIGLDSAPTDLQSGLCLVSRLRLLETLTIQMPRTASRWTKGPDLSWMEPPSFLGLSEVFQRRELSKWEPLLEQEQKMIQQRQIYLEKVKEVIGEQQDSVTSAVGTRVHQCGTEFADSLALVGTLTDVRNCMNTIAESRKIVGTTRVAWDGSRAAPRVVITGC